MSIVYCHVHLSNSAVYFLDDGDVRVPQSILSNGLEKSNINLFVNYIISLVSHIPAKSRPVIADLAKLIYSINTEDKRANLRGLLDMARFV